MVLEDIRQILADVLELGSRARQLDRESGLLGSIPEFDSMAVVSLITAIEEHFGILVEDDEISAETFESVGTLSDFVQVKLDS